jgi:hypothetical protein
LNEAYTHVPDEIDEEKPDKLSLALEPESAAIYCQYISQKQGSFKISKKKSTSYLIVDIGGGTVDISAHCLVANPEPHIRVIHEPTGNNCGGTRINEEFRHFLAELVHDTKFFGQFLSTHDKIKNSTNQNVLDQLINEQFEVQKKIFGEMFQKYKGSIELPCVFYSTYKHVLMQGVDEKGESMVKLVDQDLRISKEAMSGLFSKVVDGIVKCINTVLRELENIEFMYFVGGFGGSKYVEKVISEEYKKKGIQCIVPAEPAYAVARGAALFRMNPGVIESRRVDATYGIYTNVNFEEGLHDPKYKITNDDGKYECANIFNTVVEKGDIVGIGEVFLVTYCPASHNQKSMLIRLYSSQEKDIFYVTGEWGRGKCKPRHTVTKIGAISISMPDLSGDKQRRVDVMFNFSHTEMKVRAFDRTSKTEVKAVFNFLTTT